MSNQIRIAQDEQLLGFVLNDSGRLELILPKFYKSIPKEKKTRLFFEYYRLFEKYQEEIKNSRLLKVLGSFKNYNDLWQKEHDDFTTIEAYFTLLEDFKSSNLLFFQAKNENIHPKGAINWRKTRRQGQELIQDNSVLYLKNYYTNLRFDKTHPITVLHACILRRVFDAFNLKVRLPFKYQELNDFEANTTQIQSYLIRYEKEMYSDRQRKIFDILKQLYLNNHPFRWLYKGGKSLLYAPKLDAIWERMLKTTLFDEYNDHFSNIPKGAYQLKNQVFSGLTSIPDIIITDKQHLIILDAKNYYPDFENGTGMPKSSDISKQIMYKLLLSNEVSNQSAYPIKQIISVFILPADFSNSSEKVKYLGKHQIHDQEVLVHQSLGDIYCFQLDFETVKDTYLNMSTVLRHNLLKCLWQVYDSQKNIFSTSCNL